MKLGDPNAWRAVHVGLAINSVGLLIRWWGGSAFWAFWLQMVGMLALIVGVAVFQGRANAKK